MGTRQHGQQMESLQAYPQQPIFHIQDRETIEDREDENAKYDQE